MNAVAPLNKLSDLNTKVRDTNVIFVFGSNLAGKHGAGAAQHAYKYFNAVPGAGWGLQGRSFAIPTKDRFLRSLPVDVIRGYITEFLAIAREDTSNTYLVTAVGCGLAGFEPGDFADLWAEAPENVFVSPRFIAG